MNLNTKQVAYSVFEVKSVNKGDRTFRGMATTPSPDRDNDIVEPMGVQFRNPSVLLWMHNHTLPVGTVNFGKPTKDGVPFEASIPEIESPSQLKARVDEAWQSIESGLIRAVSIGFRPLEYSVIEETGGYRFTKTEVFELSLVSVPANAQATITQIKSIDREARAALGKEGKVVEDKTISGVTEKNIKVKLTSKEEKIMSISEKLKGFRAELESKQQRKAELAEKSVKAGETFDQAEQEEFDTLNSEVKAIKAHIERLESVEEDSVKTAKAVKAEDGSDERKAAASRTTSVTVKNVAEQVQGLGFARLARCKALARVHQMSPSDVAKKLYPDDTRVVNALEKAAVAAGTTLDSTWAAPLVPEQQAIAADFAEFLRPATILGKFGNNGIPALRNVPFRTRLLSQTSGGSANWVGEGKPKPLTKFDFAGTEMSPLKIAAISVISKELAMDSSPSAELLIRDGLRAALAERADIDFIDPAVTATANVRPASITNSVTPVASSGTDADAVRVDIQALLGQYIAANNPPTTGVLVMSAVTALSLSMMTNALGQREFPDITMNGGMLLGFPVIVSEYVPADTAGHYVIMVNASDIYYADGEVTVDMSDQASLEMNDTPTSPVTASTVMVSLWQHNLLGFLVEKRINYMKRRASAVSMLSGVNWQ